MPHSALEIQSGAELEGFDLGTVLIAHTVYTVLTGFEGTGRCFWCGGELKGKLKRYCYGHMTEYYRHFEWQSASQWALERAGHRCENCGEGEVLLKERWWSYPKSNLEVHHIVPLRGKQRYFSAYNLPWNLMVLCFCFYGIGCHKAVHQAMKFEVPKATPLPLFQYADRIKEEEQWKSTFRSWQPSESAGGL